MTKLTTERLEELANATTPSVKYVGREIIAMARQLLAYEQAAQNPIGYTDDEELRDLSKMGTAYIVNGQDVNIDVNDGRWFPVYRAPVLPKQPELVENLKKVMNSWLAMEPKLAFQPEFTDVMMLLDVEPAPAQPVSEPCKLNCWSCGNSFTYTQRLECDGYCPHCDSPIDLDEDEDEEALKAAPLEPTKEMVSMAWREAAGKCDHETIKRIYVTMLATAPAQESE